MDESRVGRRRVLRAGVTGLLGVAAADWRVTPDTGRDGSTGQGDTETWVARTERPVVTAPTVVDDSLYVGTVGEATETGRLLALSAVDGERAWTRDLGPVVTSPTVVDGVVFVGTGGPEPAVHAVDARTGADLWRVRVDAAPRQSPTVVDGTLYLTSRRGRVRALAAGSGGELWTAGTGVGSPPVVVDDTVYVWRDGGPVSGLDTPGGDRQPGRVCALDALDGSRRWSFETDDTQRGSLTVADGAVFVGTAAPDGTLYALDTDSGTVAWQAGVDGAVRHPPTVAGDGLYVAADGSLRAYSTATGDLRWRVDAAVESSPTVADGVVVGTGDGVRALDAATGEPRWRFERPGAAVTSPLVDDGVVYLSDGDLYAIDGGVDGSSGDSRAALGTLGHHGDWRHASGTVERARREDDAADGPEGDRRDRADADDSGPGVGPGVALAGLAGAVALCRQLRGHRGGSADE